MNILKYIERQIEWSKRTFGPGSRAAGLCNHIRKELDEIRNAPEDIEEWVDVIILGIDGAWRAGFIPEQIAAALEAKQLKNIRRRWPNWRDHAEDEPIEHIRDDLSKYAAPGSVVECGADEHFAIGSIIRYGDGSSALIRVDSIQLNHGGKGQHYYCGQHLYGGIECCYHSNAIPASSDDLKLWSKTNGLRNFSTTR